jgi:hypothetical protein
MVTLLEQRWLDDCFNQLHLDVGVDRVRAQKALLFLADNVEWFNYVVSKSHWGSPLKGTPATASNYIDCDLVPEIREEMARIANRPRNVVRVHPPSVGDELHSTTCAWLEINMFERRGRFAYFSLRAQFDRGDFETDEVKFQDYLVKESLVSQTTAWDLADASDLYDQMIASPKCDRVGPPKSDGSRTLYVLMIDVIRNAHPGTQTTKLADLLIEQVELAIHAGQQFDDLDLLGGVIVIGDKDMDQSKLYERFALMRRSLSLV